MACKLGTCNLQAALATLLESAQERAEVAEKHAEAAAAAQLTAVASASKVAREMRKANGWLSRQQMRLDKMVERLRRDGAGELALLGEAPNASAVSRRDLGEVSAISPQASSRCSARRSTGSPSPSATRSRSSLSFRSVRTSY